MVKAAFFMAAVVFLSSCALLGSLSPGDSRNAGEKGNVSLSTMEGQHKAGYWITRPSNDALTIIGVSSPMLKRESEIDAAKEDAAKKVAMFYGLHGSIETTHNVGANFFDYVNDSKIDIKLNQDYAMYIDRLTFDPKKDVLIVDGAVFVRFKHSAAGKTINYTPAMNADGRPEWTFSRNLPQIDGYITAVGFARNQLRFKDTVYRSTEAAVVRMIEDLYMEMQISDSVGSGYGSTGAIYAKSEGRLNGFQVIEFWIDPKTNYVYTLAIAKKVG
jgi:hypothetical protein